MAGEAVGLAKNRMAVHLQRLSILLGQMLTPLSTAGAPNEGSFYTAIWGLHVSSFLGCLVSNTRSLVKILGMSEAMPEACLYSPLAMLNLDEEGDWLARTESPTVSSFIKNEVK